MSLSENPLFGAIIGRQIGNNAHAEADRIRAESETKSTGRTADAAILVVQKLRNDLDQLDSNSFTIEAALAGMRGVTRELLAELRASDPNNPLLEKDVRDRIYDGAKEAQNVRGKGKHWEERWKALVYDQKTSYDAEATKSGPAKDGISHNAALRQHAQVPEHASDRDKLLTLVAALADELQRTSPDAQILQGNAARSIFEEFLHAEAIRHEQQQKETP